MEKARLTAESMRLLKLAKKATWGIAAKQVYFRNQLRSTQGKISTLKSSEAAVKEPRCRFTDHVA